MKAVHQLRFYQTYHKRAAIAHSLHSTNEHLSIRDHEAIGQQSGHHYWKKQISSAPHPALLRVSQYQRHSHHSYMALTLTISWALILQNAFRGVLGQSTTNLSYGLQVKRAENAPVASTPNTCKGQRRAKALHSLINNMSQVSATR